MLTGLLMVTAGHTGAVHGLFAGDVRALLDGSLAPLRNVHKFDPIIRLPLVVGMAFVIERLLAARRAIPRSSEDVGRCSTGPTRPQCWAWSWWGSSAPITRGPGADRTRRPFAGVPAYWKQTADFLAAHPDDGTALLAPGSAFATYLWGSPEDEPLQFLARSPVGRAQRHPARAREQHPDARRHRGPVRAGPRLHGFTRYLQRNGVGHLVVRNDLDRGSDVPDPVVVHQTIDESPGLTGSPSSGPTSAGGRTSPTDKIRTVVNGGWQAEYPAVEIYRVPGVSSTTSGSDPTVVVGGPEDLLDLADYHVIGSEPTVLGSDVDSHLRSDRAERRTCSPTGYARRERSYARIHDGYSATQAGATARAGSTRTWTT